MSVPLYRFDEFELDGSRFELRRNGKPLKLERIPLELLILLVEQDGKVVARQEIIERLWGKDVFVDTEHGINTAIRKIRSALRDDADRPRFVQTVPGKGYRFLAKPDNGNARPIEPLLEVRPATPAQTVPVKSRRKWLGAMAAVIFCLVAGVLLGFDVGGIRDRVFPGLERERPQIRSIAVLPLANLSGDPAQEYFADGMTDELITALAKNRSLRVVSRTSTMQYKGARRPLRDIARELGVDGILEGSVERSGNRVHVTAQLIQVASDTHVWAESYDRDLGSAMSLPDELSQTIATNVKVPPTPGKPEYPITPEAHDAYLRGRYFWFSGNDQRSQEYFEKAITIQPDYAAAWAGLADAYILRGIYDEAAAKDITAQAERAARRAIVLDDAFSGAHASLAAWYFFYSWDLKLANAECTRAIEIDPGIGVQHHLHSYILFAMNRNDEGLREQKRATELDPFVHPFGLGYAYLQSRQFDAAISELRMRADAMPNDPMIRFNLSAAYWHKSMWNESEREQEKALQLAGEPEGAMAMHRAFEQGGEKAVEEWGVRHALASARKRYVSPLAIARQYAFLGDSANTLKFLEQSYRERCPWLILVQTEPAFDFIHAQPRYQALIKKMGLPPAY